jgi:hypothetical protein
MRLGGSELDWNYETVSQKNLHNRKAYVGGGKSSAVAQLLTWIRTNSWLIRSFTNLGSGLWARVDLKDYDTWAEMVGNKRWSGEGFLPYFWKTECHYDPEVSSKNHSHDELVYTASITSGRNYPLREPLKAAWGSLGIQKAEEINDGPPRGVAEVAESRSKASPLSPVPHIHWTEWLFHPLQWPSVCSSPH